MKQVVVTHVGGQALKDNRTIGIDPEKIVWTKDAGVACEFAYAEALDRRLKPVVYQVGNTKAQIDAYITVGTLVDLTVYDEATGVTSTVSVQEKFIQDVQEAYALINATKTACRKVQFWEGAFNKDVAYVSNTLASLATAALTTTTSTTSTTTSTTTTTAAATTTTTAAATTTTTAAATTTTTAAG